MTWHLPVHITFTETPTGAVLLDRRRGKYWQLNGSAAVVVKHLLHDGDISSAVAVLADRYPAAIDVTTDVRRVVEELAAAELMVP